MLGWASGVEDRAVVDSLLAPRTRAAVVAVGVYDVRPHDTHARLACLFDLRDHWAVLVLEGQTVPAG